MGGDAAEAALRARGAGISRGARTILDGVVGPRVDEPTHPRVSALQD